MAKRLQDPQVAHIGLSIGLRLLSTPQCVHEKCRRFFLFLHSDESSVKSEQCHLTFPFCSGLSLSQDKVLSNKTPKLDRSDGVKEMKEKAPKRKLPFTAGANGDQKYSDSGKSKLGCVLLLPHVL